MGFKSSLVKSSSVNADHNPRIGKQDVGLFKVLDILESLHRQYTYSDFKFGYKTNLELAIFPPRPGV